MTADPAASDNPCRRCGTCCEKGGPSLHREDRRLVESGRIPGRCLVTFRQGEVARDNVRGTLSPLTEEIIKIKGAGGGWTCCYYDRDQRGCRLYADRPLECRALNCRDIRQIEAVYADTRLNRRDLLAGVQGVWELVVEHEQRCSHMRLRALAEEGVHRGRLKAESAILEILRFDAHLRQLTVERCALEADMLDFLFGRPLAATIGMHGVRLIEKGGRYGLIPSLPACGERKWEARSGIPRR